MLTNVQSTYDRTSVTSYADESITGPFPVFYTLNLIGNHKKTSVILLLNEVMSAEFTEILGRFNGMNQFVLIKILRQLEEDCIIKRVLAEEGGDYKVKYRLTYTGRRLIPIINELSSWGKEQRRHKALISI